MPRRSPRIPKYRLHKPSGLAVVRLDGRDVYLGAHGTDESRSRYEQVISEWLAHGRLAPRPPRQPAPPRDLSVNELILGYLDHARRYYRKKGAPTGEWENVKHALPQLSRLYGRTPLARFGPGQLKTVQPAMIEDGLCRNVINARVGRIRRMFKWGIENEVVDNPSADG